MRRLLLVLALLLASAQAQVDPDPGAQREARLLYQQGVSAHREGRLERAIDFYQSALATDPARLEARAFLGLALDQSDRPAEALEQYDLYLVQEPDDHTVGLNRAAALVHLARWGEALQALESLRVAPRLEGLRQNLRGVALLRSSQAQNAAQAFQIALQEQPELVEARVNLAAALLVLGQREQAAEELRAVLSARPQDPLANNNLGVLLAAHDRPAALSAFQAAAREPEAELNLVTLLAEQGKLNEALLAVSQVVDQHPELDRARVLYAVLLYRAQRPAEAERELAELKGFLPSLYRGLSLLAQNQARRAVGELREAVLARPDSAVAHHNLSLALAASEHLTEAVREARQAYELAPASPAAALQLGVLAIRQRQYSDAIVHFESYLRLSPQANDRELVREYLSWLKSVDPRVRRSPARKD